jgi:farnesyl diphosphate synthase
VDKLQLIGTEFERSLQSFRDSKYPREGILSEVINFILSTKGKRVRPILCLLCEESVRGSVGQSMRAAIALEMVHTYSLVHDDLPCMDNDSLRRGEPTAHVKFDEGRAVLAGTSLLTDAVNLVSATNDGLEIPVLQDDKVAREVISILTQAVGSEGASLGQAIDLHLTKHPGANLDEVCKMHALKTGLLFAASCRIGAVIGGASHAEANAYGKFGEAIGLAFQFMDDLLDDSPCNGKTNGKDAASGKSTCLTVSDRKHALNFVTELTKNAVTELENVGYATNHLIEFALSLTKRQS